MHEKPETRDVMNDITDVIILNTEYETDIIDTVTFDTESEAGIPVHQGGESTYSRRTRRGCSRPIPSTRT
jgi:hypothetical protein